MKEKIQKLLGEELSTFQLKGRGACNDAYLVKTKSGKKFIVKVERTNKEFNPQNTLLVEASIIKLLSELKLSIPIPNISFVSEYPEMFGYVYIEGELLINVWENLSENERIGICQDLGSFHSEIGQKVTKEMARKSGIKINSSTRLHPEVEKDYQEILTLADIPAEYIKLALKAKTIFDQTSSLGIFQFIHNDSHHENIIIKNKKIVGIIDFGESEFGEIAKEFSRYIRDYPDYVEYIISAYEKASGNKLSRERLYTCSFLSGLIDNVNNYKKGGESRLNSNKAVQSYKKIIDKF